MKYLRNKEKRILGLTLSTIGLLSIFLSLNKTITANIIGSNSNLSFLPYFSLVFLFGGSLLLISHKKTLEAIMVPTGPGGEIDEQRALAGARIYHKNPDRLVIISGIVSGKFPDSQSAEIYKTLRRAGVPRGQIEIEGKSKDTLENVRYTSRILKSGGIKTVYVATDRDHARRISMLFQTAKDERLIPEDLRVKTYSRGIDKAYNPIKSLASYEKDLLRAVKTGRVKGL